MADTTIAPAPDEKPKEGLAVRAEQRVTASTELSKMLMHTDDSGKMMLVIPQELSRKFNVLAPSAVMAQEITMFRPGFQVIQLDVLTDFYTMDKVKRPGKPEEAGYTPEQIAYLDRIEAAHLLDKKGERFWPTNVSINKIGLRKLSGSITFGLPGEGGTDGKKSAIILSDKSGNNTVTIQAAPFYYTAVGAVRRSDGTLKTFKAESEWDPDGAALEAMGGFNGDALWKVQAEYLKSFKFRRPMAKSKAQNAIVRDAFAIKAKYDPFEAEKPFFVVSYDFTPDGSIESQGIVAAMYGVEMSPTEALYGAAPAEIIVPEDDGVDANADVPDEVLEPKAEVVDNGELPHPPVPSDDGPDDEYAEYEIEQPTGPNAGAVVNTKTGEVVKDAPKPDPQADHRETPLKAEGPLSEDERATYLVLLDTKLEVTPASVKGHSVRGMTIGEVLGEDSIAWFERAVPGLEGVREKLDAKMIDELQSLTEFLALAHKAGI